MWYANQTFTPEEIQVLKELEYDLFMFNPGFRSMWNEKFEDYFKALFDKEAWEQRQEERLESRQNSWENPMDQDPEFRAFMQRQHLIDEVMFGDLDIKNVPIDVQQEIEEMQREEQEAEKQSEFYERLGINPIELEVEEEEDELYKKAMEWRKTIGKELYDFYETTKHADAFRILYNHNYVAAKIYSVPDYMSEDELGAFEFAWRPDRIGYTLALTSLNRCIESFENLRGFPELEAIITASLPLAKEIRQELIDRLENIEQKRLV